MKVTYPINQEKLTIKVTNEQNEDCTNKFMNYIASVLYDAANHNRNNFPITAKDELKMANEIFFQLEENGYTKM